MREVKPGTILGALMALYVLCLSGICCLLLGYFVKNARMPQAIYDTPTVDLACEEADCLQVCLSQSPAFVVQSFPDEKIALLKDEGEVRLVRYRWDAYSSRLQRIEKPQVPDYLKNYQEYFKLHRQIWDYVSIIIPPSEKWHISYMEIIADARPDAYLASVWNSNADYTWTLYVNILDFKSPEISTSVLVHEYAHLQTLNNTQSSGYWLPADTQVSFQEHLEYCDTFFTGEDCMYAESYLAKFGKRFWTGELYEAWADAYVAANNDKERKDEIIENFYLKFPDQFVSHYAASSPEEDIAESWTAFVMQPKPAGFTISEQKILFFYEYPELVQKRREIIQGVCKYAAEGN